MRARIAALAAVGVIGLALTGCQSTAAMPVATTAAPTDASPTPSVLSTLDWAEWAAADGASTLRHPDGWSVEERGESIATFRDASGAIALEHWILGALGGEGCMPEDRRELVVLWTEETELPLDAAAEEGEAERPILAAYALEDGDGWLLAAGLTTPRELEGDQCDVVNAAVGVGLGTTVLVPSGTGIDDSRRVATLDEARAWTETREHAELREVLRSFALHP